MPQNADFAATTPYRGILDKPKFFPTNLTNLDQSGASEGQAPVWDSVRKQWIPGTVSGGSTPTGPAGGDLTGTYPNPTLASIGALGPVGDGTHVAQVTTDSKGRVISLVSVPITASGGPPSGPAGGDLSGTYPNPSVVDDSHAHTPGVTIPAYPTSLPPNGPAGGFLSGTYPNPTGPSSLPPSGAAGGDLTGTYPNPTLAAIGGGAIGPIGDSTHVAQVTRDAKGRVIALTSVAISFPGGSGITLVANVTALRAIAAPVVNTLIYLEGYTAPGDGGGDLCEFIPFAVGRPHVNDDGGTFFVPGGSPPVVNAAGVITTPGTADTVGFWQRCPSMGGFQGREGCRSVMWFGATPDNSTDNIPAFRLALASLVYSSGTIHIPAGQYALNQKWMIDMANLSAGIVSITGDGTGGTILGYAMTGASDCLIEIKNGYGLGSFQDIQINRPGFAGLLSNPSVIKISSTTDFSLINVKMVGQIASVYGGGAFDCGPTNTNLTLIGCSGFNGNGTQLRWSGGSGIITANSFTTGDRGPGVAWVSGHAYGQGEYATNAGNIYMSRSAVASATPPPSDTTNWEIAVMNMPCHAVVYTVPSVTNSTKWANNFFSGGGPTYTKRECGLTATGANFTITATAHGRLAGEYITLTDFAQAGLNRYWKISSVTANTITVTVANAFTSDTGTVSTLWCCFYCNGITESDMTGCFFNTGGSPGSGSCGIFLDGYSTGNGGLGEFAISNCTCDYGNCAIFMFGLTNTDPGSSCHRITVTDCRPNGGPRDEFGAFRVEGMSEAYFTGCHCFPGNNNPPGTGVTFSAFVISDGGQANKTQDVSITGGQATTKNSSALYPAATIVAFTFDGANVHNCSVMNCGVDAAQTVVSLLNGAVASNGLTVMYGNNAGRVALFDSTGTHNL